MEKLASQAGEGVREGVFLWETGARYTEITNTPFTRRSTSVLNGPGRRGLETSLSQNHGSTMPSPAGTFTARKVRMISLLEGSGAVAPRFMFTKCYFLQEQQAHD